MKTQGKKTPVHILKQIGNDRPRNIRGKADTSGKALKVLPPPPYWMLEGLATQEYERLGNLLVPKKMITQENITSFQVYCSVFAAIVTHLTANQLPPASVLGQYRGLLQEFGLTPLSMMKFPQMMVNLGPDPEDGDEDGDEGGTPPNPFARNGTDRKRA